MLIDRVLIGLGSMVVAGGSVLGIVGFTERAQTASATSTEAPVVRAWGPIPLSDDLDVDEPTAEPSAAGEDATDEAAADETPGDETPGDEAPDDEAADDEDAEAAADEAADVAEAEAEKAAEAERAAEEAEEKAREAEERAAAEDKAETKEEKAPKPAPKPARDSDIDVDDLRETFSYGPHGTRNDMDVYRPEGTDAGELLPTVVLVHGGSWVSSSKEVWKGDVAGFLEEGYTTVAVNYRLAGDAAWPAQRTDVVAAINELRDNAGLYNVDPDRIVLLGSSAGAQIAAAAATWDGAAGLVRGFVSMSGPLDLFQIATATDNAKDAELARRVTEKLIRCTPAECADRYEDATPVNHLDPDDVPSLLVAAEGDWVDPQGARDFAAESNDLGVPSDLVMLPGAKHGMALWPAARSHAMDWIAARMKD